LLLTQTLSCIWRVSWVKKFGSLRYLLSGFFFDSTGRMRVGRTAWKAMFLLE